jgi:outer membrane protein OmpA-like peptidoglycan-associated protein
LLEIDKTYLSNYFAVNEGAEMVSMKTKTADTKTVQKTVQDDENSRLAGTLSYGDDQLPLANKEVTIKNEAGEVIGTATTNGLGSFAFRNLPLDQNYSLSVDDADMPVDAKIVLTNKAGKEIMVTRTDGKGKFKFHLLATDQSKLSDLSVEDVELLMDLNGYFFDQNSKPLSNAKVLLFNKEEVVANIITDVNGKFHFKGLSLDKNYLFMMDESDPRFKNMTKLYVADAKGKIYREIKPNTKGKFQFGLLDIDKTSLGNYFVNDPWLVALNKKSKQQQQQIVASNSKTRIAPGTKIESSISISETVLFGYAGYQLDEPSVSVLNKVLVIMNQYPDLILELRSHTDSRGSSEHNLWLSNKRANEGLNYLITRGINKSRLKGIGFGESKLVNHCHDGVECSEEEHANNRRLEFKLFEIAK